MLTRNKKDTSFIIRENIELIPFLLKKMSGMTRTSIKKLLSHKQIRLNDTIIPQPNILLHPDDKITIVGSIQTPVTFYHPQLDIIYEDKDLLVVNKHISLLAVETHKHSSEITAFSILKSYVRQHDDHNNLYIVHRIDKETSGVLLFSKNKRLQEILRHNWTKLVIKKEYTAIVHGKVKKEGIITSWLTEDNETKMVNSSFEDNGGKKSVTHYQTVRTKMINDHIFSLLSVAIETGRTNQIRAQFASMKHPIVGDRKYGKKDDGICFNRMALHAHVLEIIHPFNQKTLHFEASIPKEIEAFFKTS